jgi:CRISPR-associated endoribonuclease Cas6
VSLAPEVPGALPPPQTGPAVAAAFLNAIGLSDSDLAAYLHDGPRPKPYALTPLLDEADRPPRRGSTRTRFEIGVLADDLLAPMLAALMEDRPWRIGRTSYRRLATDVTGLASYPDIFNAAKPATTWDFHLLTPVAFSTAKEEGARRQRPLPQPEWVFRALYTRWHALAGSATSPIPDTLPVAVEEHLEVVDCELRTAEHLVKAGVPAVNGCVGTVRYALAEAAAVPASARCALDALATFATFAGIGDRTAVGMGFARLKPHIKPVKPPKPVTTKVQ